MAERIKLCELIISWKMGFFKAFSRVRKEPLIKVLKKTKEGVFQ